MNERIVEMAEEAAEYALLNQSGEALLSEAEGCDEIRVSREFIEKFAELIVKECINVVDNMADPDDSNLYFWTIQSVSKQIKQHFGVEE